ncbi:hypothetical protein [Paenibacillus sp. yr247]|uniref:hypothetical protein n=1 Tax=Paenibacillus sp. yr247 TaxID=1761880 RepID=UPI00158793DF|nr:hypothetical protein [Paenibacillus sp. yr247]
MVPIQTANAGVQNRFYVSTTRSEKTGDDANCHNRSLVQITLLQTQSGLGS